ncbi:unnamed protein product [Zymoseptoria tritici ST99CH_3D7]|uniref:MARVEL domain-containing protein n=1 Tax=Zymoseptoria tritici (strain ST99CH_3D7) TaxID=1276538 RepID=A0A1X7RZ70_ZYMT9|nr:unnamed protein product [Zymoseptoria tritici ST99CH_3D7]
MEGFRLGAWIARIFQLISAAVIIGTSISLAGEIGPLKARCKYNHVLGRCNNALGRYPSSTRFSIFVGAFGILDSLLGMAALVFAREATYIMLAIDALAAIFYFAGGTNLAVLYSDSTKRHPFVNCNSLDPDFLCGHSSRVEANITFHFIGLIATLAAVALVLLLRRSSGRSVSAI